MIPWVWKPQPVERLEHRVRWKTPLLSAPRRGSGSFRAVFAEARHRLFVIAGMCLCVFGGGGGWDDREMVTS